MNAYGLEPETIVRAELRARRYPQLEEIRADAIRRRDGMARVMHAEEHDDTTGWADAARAEYRAQGIRHSAAEKAGTVIAILADYGSATTDADTRAWTAVRTIALELRALADAADNERRYCQLAADRIPDCPTPYAHNLAHHPEEQLA